MKKDYIVPAIKEVKSGFFCKIYESSTEGIHPQQLVPNASGDRYVDNPDVDQIYSKDRGFYGSYDSEW